MNTDVAPPAGQSLAASLSGVLAILLWSPAAVILAHLQHVPSLWVLLISFGVCFVSVAVSLTLSNGWHAVMHLPALCWLTGVLGIVGNNLCYLIAIGYAPIAHVVLIGYLWPITVLAIQAVLFKQTIAPRQWLGALVSFTGIAVLVLHDAPRGSDFATPWVGYGFAFASGTLWAVHCTVSGRFKAMPIEMMGMYCGVGAVLAAIMITFTGLSVSLSSTDILLMISLGASAFGGAFLLWDFGIKHGHMTFLCLLAFFIPVLSTALLILFHQALLTRALLVALGCVTAGAYLARTTEQHG